ncbi:acetyl-CoA carboxylase biotin carboxyl carrier protein [uncultured Flavobacterium sp.]|uniref:acetyl-CoA carboxylase biotin carboxyl carrier protein n=1 Tax=uncultured Flavobacterium sp. TaxID=165435 RepID=UPI00261D0CBB|nr:acetyl-CoA carboxylase biotin carboxyl carrier protein [uncultured Flavobacterium sp.]
MDIKEIQNLIKLVAKSGATEVKLEMDDFKITIKTTEAGAAEASYFQNYPNSQPMQMVPQQQQQQQQAPVQAAPVATPVVESDENSKYVVIKSPMIGTLYRKPAPDKAPFVEVGATISKGDPVCVIEAMKLFNEIEAEISGKIVKILVDDMSPVEFDQPLFLVDPS